MLILHGTLSCSLPPPTTEVEAPPPYYDIPMAPTEPPVAPLTPTRIPFAPGYSPSEPPQIPTPSGRASRNSRYICCHPAVLFLVMIYVY